MQELVDVLATAKSPPAVRLAAQRAFLQKRAAIWEDIRDGNFPKTYVSVSNKKFVGAPARTAIRCDFLLACKITLGAKYKSDQIADFAQRELLFYVLRDRETFPNRTGKKFYCCTKCTSKLLECVSQKVFRYIDNARWKAEIEADRQDAKEASQSGQPKPPITRVSKS
jgi:hypothetical protein